MFVLACATSFLLYVHRYVWNIVNPMLQQEYELDQQLAGWVFAAFYVTYAAGQIPSGVFVDRFGPHRFLAAIIGLWSATVAGFGITGNLWGLGVLRAVFGAAQAGCYPALAKVTRLWFPLQSRTVIQGWVATTSGRSGGAMSSILLGTLLMGWCGLTWRQGLFVLSGCGVLFAIAFWFVFRNSPEEHSEVNAAELELIRDGTSGVVLQSSQTRSQTTSRDPKPPTSDLRGSLPWGEAFRNRSLRVFVVQQYLDAGSDVVFVSLIGAYFLQAHHIDIKATGWLTSLPLWGGALGGIVGGWLNEWWILRSGNRRWARSLIGAIGKFIGCGVLLAMAALTDPVPAGLALGIAKFFSDWSQPTTWGTCTDLGGRYSATVFSIINTSGTLGGVIMPPLFGWLLDAFTRTESVAGELLKVTNWSPLFYLVAAMYLGSGVCWLLIDCTRTMDR